jgi:hypothetical protein
MKTSDFRTKATSAKLKEGMSKMFGVNVNFDKYSREQLEDMRNKLRTRVFQQEGRAGINDLLTNETYQKDKAMLALLNTRIKEMLGEQMQQLRDKMTQLSEAKKEQSDKKKCPPMSHIKKMCQDGKTVSEICKMHPDCDQKELKQMVADCKKKMDEGKKAKPDFLDMDKDGNKKEPMKKAVTDKKAGPKKGVNPFAKVKEGAKPDFLDMDKDGNKKEPMKKAVADKKAGPKKGVNPFAKVKEGFPTVADATKNAQGTAGMKQGEKKKSSTGGEVTKTATGLKHTAGKNYGGRDAPKAPDSDKKSMKTKESVSRLSEANAVFKLHVAVVNESLGYLLAEDEEGKAKAITSAGDMVNDFTSWMQRVGQYQTKTMIELADAIKADFGAAEAEAFKQAVGPALSATLETLTQQREAVSGAVATLAGEATPDAGMGMDPMAGGMEPPMDPGMEPTEPDAMNPAPAGDEFGASDAAAGMGTTGREMRESKFARKLAESHSILSKLAK